MNHFIASQYAVLAAVVAAFISLVVLMVTAVLVEEWRQ